MKKKFLLTVFIKRNENAITKELPDGGLGKGVLGTMTLKYNLEKRSDYKSDMFQLALYEEAEAFAKR